MAQTLWWILRYPSPFLSCTHSFVSAFVLDSCVVGVGPGASRVISWLASAGGLLHNIRIKASQDFFLYRRISQSGVVLGRIHDIEVAIFIPAPNEDGTLTHAAFLRHLRRDATNFQTDSGLPDVFG